MSLPFPLHALEERFALAASDCLDMQLFVSHDADELLRVYLTVTQTGYQQYPFMPAHWLDERDSVVWVMAVRNGEPVGLMAARRLFAYTEGMALSDALANGLLYRQEGVLADRGMLPGKGPTLPAPGLALYQGCGWVHPRHQAQGLPGVLSRICNLQALKAAPELALVWGLEEARAARAGVMARRSATAAPHVEAVFSGFHTGVGFETEMCAVWGSRDDFLSILLYDWNALEATGRLPWVRPTLKENT